MQSLSASREANRVKNEFLAAVSHDLRTPLNAIIGYTELLAHSSLGGQQREFVALARRAADKLLLLIDMLLELSRLEHGRLQLLAEPFEIRELIDSQLELLRPRAQSKGLSMSRRIDTEVPQWVTGDGARVGQIVSNLLGNAVKFTETGSVDLSLEVPVTGWLRLTVCDSGPGIPKQEREAIFEWFSKGMHGNSQREGSGLGLRICLELVRLMGGSIDVDEAPGGGACFAVVLPLAATTPPEAAADAPAARHRQHSAAPPSSHALRPGNTRDAAAPSPGETVAHALVAEDDPTNRLLLQRLLERFGVTSEAVSDGQAACAQIIDRSGGDSAYDIIFMDSQMPRMSGAEAIAAIRAHEAAYAQRATPIVTVSAHAVEEVRRNLLKAGSDCYLTKPVTLEALSETLRRLLPRLRS
nr:ATP-binding protein [Halorhodospira abdelmalekii]